MVRTFSTVSFLAFKLSVVSPSVVAAELQQVSSEEALAFVDAMLGPPASWSSPLLEYRLGADFQADWKAELGHWLKAAERFGFVDELVRILIDEKERPSKSVGVDANDKHHLKVHQHTAGALFCHYFTGTGWSFKSWETERGGAIDIDLTLNAPNGARVDFQVKAPDQPGRLVQGRFVDGNFDDRIVTALNKAAKQLPQPARSPAFIAVFPQRSILAVTDPSCFVEHLFGSTIQLHGDSQVYLATDHFGVLMRRKWDHVAGVVVIDMIRGVEEIRYACTVFLNPNATHAGSPDWFQRARVAVLEGDTFRWIRGEPGGRSTLPDGTRVVERLPRLAGT